MSTEPTKTVLITGADGFLGRNLQEALKRQPGLRIHLCDVETAAVELDRMLAAADVVFHLAGVNRPRTEQEFFQGNVGFTQAVCARLSDLNRRPKIVFASSIQAALDNPYGKSKREAESELERFAATTGAELAIYRLPNVFGKWCRPNYNSVVATFCHNIARDLPISIADPERILELVYIDDVVAKFIEELSGGDDGRWKSVPISVHVTLGLLADLLTSFRACRENLVLPDLSDPFARKLYATFLSYLPEDDFGYSLKKRSDERGELGEFIKSGHFGQLFVSRTKPGMTRGNHYHDTKCEKFLVLEGDGLVRFRHIERRDVIEYRVTGRDLRVLDIPPGYTHSIENTGETDMIVLFWASEVFDACRPDTFFAEVAPACEEIYESRYDRRHAA